MTELETFLVAAIQECVATSPLNRLRDIDGSPMFEEPLVGFADGDDPLFELFKTVVGEFHLTPRQALAAQALAAQAREASAAEPPAWPRVGVVSWILPAAEATRRSNREMTDGASRRWNHTRFQGEEFNDHLRRHVVGLLQERGYLATAPVVGPQFDSGRWKDGWASTWSERHIAYAAGLGTFSLSDGLITAKGVAHRCGSVVVNAHLPASPRPYTDHRQYCRHTRDGSCGVCIERCPAGAIGPAGHDKDLCREYALVTLASWANRPGYIGSYGACGLCQTGVPCESQVPPRS